MRLMVAGSCLCEERLNERREMPRRPAFVATSKIVAASADTSGANIERKDAMGRLSAMPATGSLAQP